MTSLLKQSKPTEWIDFDGLKITFCSNAFFVSLTLFRQPWSLLSIVFRSKEHGHVDEGKTGDPGRREGQTGDEDEREGGEEEGVQHPGTHEGLAGGGILLLSIIYSFTHAPRRVAVDAIAWFFSCCMPPFVQR